MEKKRILALVPLALALASGPAWAQRTVSGTEVARRTERLTEAIDWKDGIEECQAAAQEAKKMVFWLQIVGDLDGGL